MNIKLLDYTDWYSKHSKWPEFDKLYYFVTKDVNNNASNIIIWVALAQHVNGKLFFRLRSLNL